MTQQTEITAARPRRFNSVDTAEAPVDDVTEPMFTGSPLAPTGQRTTGFLIILKAPTTGSATAPADGFTVTPWIRDPTTKVWGSGVSYQIPYGQAWVCGDVGASELYFQIADATVDGEIDVHFAEL